MGSSCLTIKETLQPLAKTDDFLLIIGGDHCIPIGTLSALTLERKDMGIIWVDAHADINTPQTSGSGNMHGMPLGFLLGLVEKAETYPGNLRPYPENINMCVWCECELFTVRLWCVLYWLYQSISQC